MLQPEGTSWERERLLESLEAYRCGLGDPPLLRKWQGAHSLSDAAGQGQAMAFVISTDDVDRAGDVIAAEGWKLESYQRNPVFLWAHDYARPVIGRAVAVWQEPHRLLARMEFAPTQFAQEVAMLYRAGYQQGVSVGFRPLRYEERRQERTGAFLGIHFLEQELLETSAVPVPANRNALRRALEEAPRAGEYLHRQAPAGATRPGGTPSLASALDRLWPELSARIDDLDKLAEELVQWVAEAELAGDNQDAYAPPYVHPYLPIEDVLAALRKARS